MSENETVTVSKDKLIEIFDITEEVRAIETLEYHNKNRLSGNDASRSRKKIELLTEAMNSLSDVL